MGDGKSRSATRLRNGDPVSKSIETLSRRSASGIPGQRWRVAGTPGAPTRRPSVAGLVQDIDHRAAEALRPVTLPALRVLLGLLFIWFGALKVFGASPVQALVAGTLPWVDPSISMAALGGVEVALGVGLVIGFAVRLVLPALAAHLSGTFLTFVMLPDMMFRDGNPLLLTESGEFVTKNLVLIAATLVLFAHTRARASVRGLAGAAARR